MLSVIEETLQSHKCILSPFYNLERLALLILKAFVSAVGDTHTYKVDLEFCELSDKS